MTGGRNPLPIAFMLFWSVGTLGFDALAGYIIYQRWHSLTFQPTTGLVTLSAVKSSRDSDGTTYRPEIHFSYEVNGQKLEGTQYQAVEFFSSDGGAARRIVAEYPINKSVIVYYDPGKPSRAFLHTGFDGGELFLAYFMIPFNCIWLGLCMFTIPPLARGLRGKQTSDFGRIDDESHLRARLGWYSPVLSWVVGFGATAFLGTFAIGFGIGVTLPSVLWAWGIAFAGGFLAAIVVGRIAASGRWDLVIDRIGGRLRLPRAPGRKDQRWISRDEIADVDVKELITRSTEMPPISARLLLQDGRIELISRFIDRERADAFVAWVKATLRLPPSPSHAAAEMRSGQD